MASLSEYKRFYIYGHYTKDTNELFYIGKGTGRRAYEKGNKRNQYWKNIALKHGYRVEILIKELNEDEAILQEILGIKQHKPKANLTKGGVGVAGYKRSKEDRQQISNRMKGEYNPRYGKPGTMANKKLSETAKDKLEFKVYSKRRGKTLKEIYGIEKAEKLSKNIFGRVGGKFTPWNKGKKYNQSMRSKLSRAHGIEKIYVYYKDNFILYDVWDNMTKCAEDLGMYQPTISKYINGRNQFHKRNKCPYFFSKKRIENG